MYIYKFPEADAEYKQYVKKSGNGTLTYILSLGAIIGGATLYEKNEAMASILMGGGVIFLGFTIHLWNKASNHLSKSVWLYNRDVLGQYY
jgi:hypothetical protein